MNRSLRLITTVLLPFVMSAGAAYAQVNPTPTDTQPSALTPTLPSTVTPPVYLGEVATRAEIPMGMAAPAAGTEFMSRSFHYARQTISQLQVAFPNFYVNATVGEQPIGGTATLTASVEYPAGTFTQLKFNGAVSATMPNGGFIVSDVAKVAIPNGAKFYVREFYQNAAGFPYTGSTIAQTNLASYGEGMLWAPVGLTDLTMGGTVGVTNTAIWDRPLAAASA